MSTQINSSEPKMYRATFHNLKLVGTQYTRILAGDFEMELRPVIGTDGLYEIFFVANQSMYSKRRYSLLTAKEKCRLIFCAQLTEWTEVKQDGRI